MIYDQETLKFYRIIQTARILFYKMCEITKIYFDWLNFSISFPPRSKKEKKKNQMLGQKLSWVALFKTFHCRPLRPASHSACYIEALLDRFCFFLPLTIDNVKVSNVKRYEDGWEFKAMQQLVDSPYFLFCLLCPSMLSHMAVICKKMKITFWFNLLNTPRIVLVQEFVQISCQNDSIPDAFEQQCPSLMQSATKTVISLDAQSLLLNFTFLQFFTISFNFLSYDLLDLIMWSIKQMQPSVWINKVCLDMQGIHVIVYSSILHFHFTYILTFSHLNFIPFFHNVQNQPSKISLDFRCAKHAAV